MSEKAVWSLAELADMLGAELRGDPALQISGVHTLTAAGPTQLSFLALPRYASELLQTHAGAVLLRPADAEGFAGNALMLANPYLAYAKVTRLFDRSPRPAAPRWPGPHLQAGLAGPSRALAAHCPRHRPGLRAA